MEEYLIFTYINQNPEDTKKVVDELGALWALHANEITVDDVVLEKVKLGYFDGIEYDPFMSDIDKKFLVQNITINEFATEIGTSIGSVFGLSKALKGTGTVIKDLYMQIDKNYVPVANKEAFINVFSFVKQNAQNLKESKDIRISDFKPENFLKFLLEPLKQTEEKVLKPKMI